MKCNHTNNDHCRSYRTRKWLSLLRSYDSFMTIENKCNNYWNMNWGAQFQKEKCLQIFAVWKIEDIIGTILHLLPLKNIFLSSNHCVNQQLNKRAIIKCDTIRFAPWLTSSWRYAGIFHMENAGSISHLKCLSRSGLKNVSTVSCTFYTYFLLSL